MSTRRLSWPGSRPPGLAPWLDRLARRHGLVVVVVGELALAGADALTGQDVVLLTFLAFGPLVLATFRSPREIGVSAALAVLLAVVVGVPDGIVGTRDHAVRVTAVLSAGLVAVALAHSRVAREQALTKMTRAAQVVQRAILRPLPARAGPLQIAAGYQSADQQLQVGGDLYDVVRRDGHTMLIIGDVRGSGAQAVAMATTVLGAFRLSGLVRDNVAEVAGDLDRAVAVTAGEEDFVTALLLDIADDGTASLVNRGHHPPVLVDHTLRPVATKPGLPLGFGGAASCTHLVLPPGARLVGFTDGLVEARGLDGGMFVPPPQLLIDTPLASLPAALFAVLAQHTGNRRHDDVAVLALQFGGRTREQERQALAATTFP